ncbi:MAG: hypothetical protein AAGI07_01495, partial [Bacteroidota bacterium]
DQIKLDKFFLSNLKKHVEEKQLNHHFTQNVIELLNKPKANLSKYKKPLISGKFKMLLGLSIIALFLLVFYYGNNIGSGYSIEIPVSILNLLNFYQDFFTSENNLILILSAVSVGFWSLMFLDKIMNRLSLS